MEPANAPSTGPRRKEISDMDMKLWPATNAMRGFAKAAVQINLTAIAYNLKRTQNIIQQGRR